MAELADEELSGVIPSQIDEEDIQDSWQDVGYYTDEQGIRHWGVIPKQKKLQTKVTWDNSTYNNKHSSDPRYMNTYE